ncbi:hypothetical protein A374_01479 [Fictibacillus macauensis ZFHKF-1]|uniref:Uncharacterized protein n=1 Tax=Fictibacillus macauensis ZFHKF-1 TaxID=1196324 RepID=I8AMI9_9BACL|nr:hypothetical protein [Fictibacillus macauensis]EIT87197.1 hypothetical protein A374_01479 [Fictibacillus macauensis ZFHKF-1]
MLKKQKEEDLYSLRNIAKKRLYPGELGGFLWASLFMSGVMTLVLTFGVYATVYSHVPFWTSIANWALCNFFLQFLFALFFSKGKNAFRFQKTLLLLVIFYSIKLPFDYYTGYYFFTEGTQHSTLFKNTSITLAIGGIIFLILFTIRGFVKMRKGDFKENGPGLYNFRESKFFFSLPVIFGVTLFVGTIIKLLSRLDTDLSKTIQLTLFLLALAILHYALVLAIPEIILVAYCKFRFKSFIIAPRKPPLQETPREVILRKRKPIERKASKTAKSDNLKENNRNCNSFITLQ